MYKDIDDVEEEFANAKKSYTEIEEHLSVDGLSKQEIRELKVKRKAIAREMNVLAKIIALETKTRIKQGGENRRGVPYGPRATSSSKIIGYLMFQFMLLIFLIVSFNTTISILAIIFSISFLVISIPIMLLARKTNRAMWTKNKEKIEKPLFIIIIVLTILNLLLGVVILLSS